MTATTLLKVFVTNLGKYNEGELIGEWVSLPIDESELEEVLERIGINEQYEEYFITDFETEFDGLDIDEYSKRLVSVGLQYCAYSSACVCLNAVLSKRLDLTSL